MCLSAVIGNALDHTILEDTATCLCLGRCVCPHQQLTSIDSEEHRHMALAQRQWGALRAAQHHSARSKSMHPRCVFAHSIQIY